MSSMRTLLTHASLIDCVAPPLRPDSAVLIEDGRISEIFAPGATPSIGDAQVVDLGGAYLLPGLWDVHVHPDYLSLAEVPLADQVTLFGHRLQSALLDSGIVGFRCAGAHSYMDVAWKRAFESGQHLGPRVFASGYFLTTTAGHFLTSGHALEVDGPYGWVKAIREQIKAGVDHIKLNLSGGIMGPAWDLHRHSFLLDDECIELFLAHDVWYVPTLAISHLTPSQANNDWEQRWVRNRAMAHALCCRAEAASDVHKAGFV